MTRKQKDLARLQEEKTFASSLRCLENAKIYQFQVAVAEESGNLKRGLTLKCLNYLIKSAVLELSSEFFYFTNILWDL